MKKNGFLKKAASVCLSVCVAACLLPTAALATVENIETSNGSVQILSGANRYETSAQEALSGWGTSEWAVIASGESWPDALAASSLAGALDCPLILTASTGLPTATSDALEQLGVSKAVVVGGSSAVSDVVLQNMKSIGVSTIERVSGTDRYGTQLEIYNYGRDKGLWSQDGIIVACGAGDAFADALSASPLGFATKYPVFLANENGEFTVAQELTLLEGARNGYFKSSIILGGDSRVTEQTEGYLQGISRLASGNGDASTRLAGANRFETSAVVAKWAVDQGLLTWDGVAFASGWSAYDALGGGALQGHSNGVLLLVGEGYTTNATKVLTDNSDVKSIRILGGTAAVSENARTEIMDALGISESKTNIQDSSVSYRSYNITLDALVKLEVTNSQLISGGTSYSYEDMYALARPDSCTLGDATFYQFAVLSDGYSGAVTAEQLDAFINLKVASNEKKYGVTSKLRGTGAYFIEAAKQYNVNEVYLLAHAALESGWGCSPLSQGTVSGYEGYYNFFGVGAVDNNANRGGAAKAKKEGWNTVEKAILGAGKWISDNYINATASTNAAAAISGSQNTLYKMRFDVQRAVITGNSVYHQYASGSTWAANIASLMNTCLTYCGKSATTCGMRYEVPKYAG